MAHGGKREGAGRKKGSLGVKGKVMQEITVKASQEGIMPLEVMLYAMRSAWDAEEIDKAVTFANLAAPYVHAKLSSVRNDTTLTGPDGQPVQMMIGWME